MISDKHKIMAILIATIIVASIVLLTVNSKKDSVGHGFESITTASECDAAGGLWLMDSCQEQFGDDLGFYDDEDDCFAAGGIWINNVCEEPFDDDLGFYGSGMSESLLAMYRFNSEDATDLTSNENHGIVYGASFVESEGFDGAFSFDGGSYIELSNYLDDANVIGAWIKTSSDNSNQRIITNGAGEVKWTLQISNGYLMLAEGSTNADQVVVSNQKFNDDSFHLVVGVLDPLKLFVDGKEVAVHYEPSTISVLGLPKIGAKSSEQYFFNGLIDEVFVLDAFDSVDFCENLEDSFDVDFNCSLLGDVSGLTGLPDGLINLADAIAIAKHVMIPSFSLTPEQLESADVDCNFGVNLGDAIELAKITMIPFYELICD
jgi:hypothetical protein